jgi:hypothetical protein
MIHGVVNFRYELTLPLVVSSSNGQREFVSTDRVLGLLEGELILLENPS